MRRALAWLGVALALAGTASAAPGVSDTEIALGASTSLSGPLAFTGEQLAKFGVDLYVKAVNESGGIHGRKLRTVYYDDGYRPGDALANTKKLVEDDAVLAVIAPLGTAPVTATLDYLEERRVPLLFPYEGSPLGRGKRYVFGGMTRYDRQSRMMVDYLVGQRRYRRFAALYGEDAYGRAFVGYLERDLARHGLRLATASVRDGPTDIPAQVARLRAAKPQVTFLVLTPGPAARALRERVMIGWTDTVMVSVGSLTDERYLALAMEASEGVEGLSLWPDPVASELPGVVRYRELMKKYFPTNEPTRSSLAGYFAAMLFTEAATRAGRDLTREGLVAALESLKSFESGILPPLTIGPDHDTQTHGFWIRVERGHFKPLTDWLTAE